MNKFIKPIKNNCVAYVVIWWRHIYNSISLAELLHYSVN